MRSERGVDRDVAGRVARRRLDRKSVV